MALRRHGDSLAHTMRTIERRVLQDVWIGPCRCAVTTALTVTVTVTAVAWCRGGPAPAELPRGVPLVTVTLFLVASAVSAVALARRRYPWCCAAAYSGGLAAVIGIGAFWWLRTGRHQHCVTWLVVADLTTVVLTAIWLTVIVAPIERSQPDIRSS